MTDDPDVPPPRVREPDPTLGSSPHAGEPSLAAPSPADASQNAESSAHDTPRRERVVLADPSRPTTVLRSRAELEEQTSWGELLVKDLVRAQLRTGLALATLVLVLLGALPLAFYLSPSFATVTVLGVPLAWVLLAALPFPLLFVVGLVYNRLAERHERAFVDMIES